MSDVRLLFNIGCAAGNSGTMNISEGEEMIKDSVVEGKLIDAR